MAGSYFSYINSGITVHFSPIRVCPLCFVIRSDPDYFRAYLLRIEVWPFDFLLKPKPDAEPPSSSACWRK